MSEVFVEKEEKRSAIVQILGLMTREILWQKKRNITEGKNGKQSFT